MRKFFPKDGFYTLDLDKARDNLRKQQNESRAHLGKDDKAVSQMPQDKQYRYLLNIFSSLEELMTELQQCLEEF